MLLGVFLWACSHAKAEMLPSRYLRELAISSDTIVLAKPVKERPLPETDRPGSHQHKCSFVVEEVLKGDVQLKLKELEVYDRGLFVLSSPFYDKNVTEIKSAMLFLKRERDNNWDLEHLYVCTPDNVVIRPMQFHNPGSYVLKENLQLSWTEAKRIVQNFLPQVEALRALRKIPDAAERNRRLFSWLTEHEEEFGEGAFLPLHSRNTEPRKGWGTLEHEIFQWILEGGISADSWLAIQRCADLERWKNNDWSLSTHPSHFSHAEGRSFLLEKLVDEKQLLIARRTAAAELSLAINPGSAAKEKAPRLGPVTSQEQAAIIRAMLPLAGHDDTHLRHNTLRLLLEASAPFNESGFPQLNKMAFPTITAALLKERNYDLLSSLPESLHHLMDEPEWQAVTGNSGGICVTLNPQIHEGVLQLWAHPTHLPAGVTVPVDLILERLDVDDTVVESSTRKVGLAGSKKWDADWNGSVVIEDVPIEGLKAGLWKARLKGVSADERKLPWTSWHTCFHVR